jgi:hypothetical protein
VSLRDFQFGGVIGPMHSRMGAADPIKGSAIAGAAKGSAKFSPNTSG